MESLAEEDGYKFAFFFGYAKSSALTQESGEK